MRFSHLKDSFPLHYPSGGDKRGLRLTLSPGLRWRTWCHLRVRPLDAPPVPCQQKLFERLTTRSASSVKLARYIDQGEGGGVPCKLRFCAICNNFSRFSPVVESYDHMLPHARQPRFEPHWRFSFANMKKYRFSPGMMRLQGGSVTNLNLQAILTPPDG